VKVAAISRLMVAPSGINSFLSLRSCVTEQMGFSNVHIIVAARSALLPQEVWLAAATAASNFFDDRFP